MKFDGGTLFRHFFLKNFDEIMMSKINYLIGVDGGGTGTRVAIADCNGVELARGTAGASGLRNGADFAWNSILKAIDSAFRSVSLECPELAQMAIGLGLAGVHNKQWAATFLDKNPGFAQISLETDAYTTLLGAHQGQPGGIVAIGTGSVGESIAFDGTRIEVGGWGFPCGDEAGGAWLGLRAVNHLQQVIDGRAVSSAFSEAIFKHCGGHRDAVFNWLAVANQGSYAQLAPIVVDFSIQENYPVVADIMQAAAQEIVKIAQALDATNTLPIALCGGLALSFKKYLPAALISRLVTAHGDSTAGGLLLIKKTLTAS